MEILSLDTQRYGTIIGICKHDNQEHKYVCNCGHHHNDHTWMFCCKIPGCDCKRYSQTLKLTEEMILKELKKKREKDALSSQNNDRNNSI